jgi:hypothetical protein
MIHPDSIKNPLDQLIELNNIIKIEVVPEYDIIDYDLLDEKDHKKYMSDIEKVVRNSFEYREFVKYLRENMDMNKCSFFENVNNIDTFKIKIHLHHHPLTLYDICQIVINKRSFYLESLEIELVAKEVMFLHYNLMIGLIPLSETVHELVHNKYLFIPSDKALGRYKEFIEMYKDFMTAENLDTLERIDEFTSLYNENENNYLLDRNYCYVDLSGAYDFPTLDEIINMMNENIKQHKSPQLIQPIVFINRESNI